MRAAFSDAIVAMASADPRVLLLTGDHGYALFDAFRKARPRQYINCGIAEQNMVGVAAGLARAGYRPIVYGLAAFVPTRVVEQIKIDVCYETLPVLFVGDGAGFVYSHLGASHQSTEDIACTRSIPNLSVYSPADRFELAACMRAARDAAGPVYLRMGKSDRGDVHSGAVSIGPGALLPVHDGEAGRNGVAPIAFIATGSLVRTAVELAAGAFPTAFVWSAPSIKPIDTEAVAAICRGHSAVVVLEEHSTSGGLGSVVAEIASERAPVRLLRVGVRDRFSEFCGSYEYLLREHGLDRQAIETRISDFVALAAQCP